MDSLTFEQLLTASSLLDLTTFFTWISFISISWWNNAVKYKNVSEWLFLYSQSQNIRFENMFWHAIKWVSMLKHAFNFKSSKPRSVNFLLLLISSISQVSAIQARWLGIVWPNYSNRSSSNFAMTTCSGGFELCACWLKQFWKFQTKFWSMLSTNVFQ